MTKEEEKAEKKELEGLRNLRAISNSLDSPDLGVAYTAAAELMQHQAARSLLPKIMSILNVDDLTLRKLNFRFAGMHAFGPYIPSLFQALESINPAEREQVLQSVEEAFSKTGGPLSSLEQKRWVEALDEVGHEHQATVFGIMAHLGRRGARWVGDKIRKQTEIVSYGSVPKILSFRESTAKRMLKTLAKKAAKRKPELLEYICGVVDQSTIGYLAPFLSSGDWKTRAEVAKAIGKIGITSASGIVMEIVSDPDWRVKQALLEKINISDSRLTSLLKIIDCFANDSHVRVRGQAERTLLNLGHAACDEEDLDEQRDRIMRKFRQRLLDAATNNPDIDSNWMGVEVEEHPIPYMAEADDSQKGISLSDIAPSEEEAKSGGSEQAGLLSALLKAKDSVNSGQKAGSSKRDAPDKLELDDDMSETERFMRLLKYLSGGQDRDVTLEDLHKKAGEANLTEEDLEEALEQLEREGTVYRSKKGAIRRVDMEL
ncbi:HEAT repeat domain-containing protein [Candidatus Thorarchaeota archaeon]|nr:MAG: HEAT repeat domain-containing protein [Candidatus Thorarchaeota archaeon]